MNYRREFLSLFSARQQWNLNCACLGNTSMEDCESFFICNRPAVLEFEDFCFRFCVKQLLGDGTVLGFVSLSMWYIGKLTRAGVFGMVFLNSGS